MAIVQSRAIGPTSDLVVLAPWRDGIIGADEAILPATRFALTFRALFQIRRTAREATEPTAFSDPIERLEQVHSFRVVAQPAGMLLSVTYDFGWEAYMRALWREGGPFLDLLLCNCKDYAPARETDLGAWSAWVRAREMPADYFYAATSLTVADMQALAQAEVLQRDAAKSDLKLARFASRPAEAAAAETRARFPETAKAQALRILSSMHRLTRYHGTDINAGTPLAGDALTLLRATRGLLLGWDPATLTEAEQARHARELAWFAQARPAVPKPAPAPAEIDRRNIQRGILSAFDRDGVAITHGAMLHMTVSDPAAARRSLGLLALASEAGGDSQAGGGAGGAPIYRNLGLTLAGLKRLGLPADLLDTLPASFHEGAAGRAGSVGDVRSHHPLRWKRLPGNWRGGFVPDAPPTIDLAIVDAVIQLRTVACGQPVDLADPRHPLLAEIERLATGLAGWVLLSVEALNPAYPNSPGHDHFGFADGLSQPALDAVPGRKWSDKVPASDILLGYQGAAGTAAYPLRDSSFLAIRRMPMRAPAFEAMITAGAAATGLHPDVIAAKIVGRDRNGTPLVPHHGPNDFDFGRDPNGARVPRQSHVRRVNPRDAAGPAVPRIMRRGMGFGPPAAVSGSPNAERGNMFMAYCADLAEQYEVVLRWMNGANSSRIGSWLGDPLCGVPDLTAPRTFRFAHGRKVHRIALPAAAAAPVGLSWSLYLLAPSLDLVRRIAATRPAPVVLGAVGADRLGKARRLVASLVARNALEAEWRNWLDEPAAREAGMQAAVWQVIRDDHGGVLHAHDGRRPTLPSPGAPDPTPIPPTVPPRQDLVLVARREAILEVIRDDGSSFSVRGAGRRIAPSIEKFHLGLDAFTADYRREGPACNAALARVTEPEGFDAARAATAEVLRGLLADGATPVRVDIVKHLLEPAIAVMAPAWFGLPDGRHIAPGASDWRDIGTRATLFPGDFWNSSRYAFNPFESAETERASAIHGQAILKAAHTWISATGRGKLTGSVTRELAAARSGVPGETGLAFPTDHDLARGVVGGMLGWVATTLGNGARLFDAWTTTATLQRKQIGWLAMPVRNHATALKVFDADMKATIGLAPVPECKWREAAVDTSVAGKSVRRDAKLVLGLASAAAECPADSHIWFGQAPPGTVPAPHGCPGRSLALGVLLGVLAGVSETVLARPTGARLEIEISPLPDSPPAGGTAAAQ